jgi:adenylosuccinate lyase
MPHKRNPILAERLTGMARLLRGYALAGMEDQALWHERDISHSSVERIALPGATTLLHYMLERFRGLLDGLVVRPDRMAHNIAAGRGLHASSRVLSALIEAGRPRPEAYGIVQRLALRAADEGASFRALVEVDPAVTAALSGVTIERCFDDRAALRHVATIIARLEALDAPRLEALDR